ncbi:TPA: MFS transporter [Candidatus Poribacteria bacterium]|nr:MFS transporter [Candidatus Poribacteria bacterium]
MKKFVSPFILLCGTGMFAIFSSTISKNPVLPLFSESLGASKSTIGLIASASTVVGILSSLPAGVLSDFYGRRRVILLATFVFASAPFFYFLVKSTWQLAIVRIYHGFATAIFGPVAMALVADLFLKRRGENMGWYSSSTLVGRSLAPIVGGVIIDLYGFKSVYFGCGVAGIIAFLLSIFIPIKHQLKSNVVRFSVRIKDMGRGLKEITQNRGIMVTSCVEAIQYLAFGAFETFLPLYCIAIGMEKTLIGALFTIQLIGTTLTKPVMGRFSDKYGRRQMISIGLITGAIALGMIPFLKSFWTMIPASVLFGISLSTVTVSTAAFVSDLAKSGSYGSALGVMSTIMDVGHASGPIISGLIIAKFGYLQMFLIIAIILFIVGGSFSSIIGKTKT